MLFTSGFAISSSSKFISAIHKSHYDLYTKFSISSTVLTPQCSSSFTQRWRVVHKSSSSSTINGWFSSFRASIKLSCLLIDSVIEIGLKIGMHTSKFIFSSSTHEGKCSLRILQTSQLFAPNCLYTSQGAIPSKIQKVHVCKVAQFNGIITTASLSIKGLRYMNVFEYSTLIYSSWAFRYCRISIKQFSYLDYAEL